jgi:hypothetical protein
MPAIEKQPSEIKIWTGVFKQPLDIDHQNYKDRQNQMIALSWQIFCQKRNRRGQAIWRS